MADKSGKMQVGLCAAGWQEVTGRWVEGILRYLGETPDLGFRDFLFMQGMEMDEMAPPPPWTDTVDGALLGFGLTHDQDLDEFIRWLDRGNAKVVSLVWDWSHPRVPQVMTDIDAVLTRGLDYMIGKGHERFALVDNTQIAPQDRESYRSFFTRQLASRGLEAELHALPFLPAGVHEDVVRIREEEGLVRILRESPKPLGLLAMNDAHALAVCCLCEELGIAVPEKVAILGVGDFNIARRHSPSISSVRTDAGTVGYEAVKLLHRLMKGEEPPDRPILIGPEGVIERESTCPNFSDSGDIRRAVEFIRTHACEGINVNDVVRHSAVARRTLEKLFAKRLGRSPAQEIREVRLERIKRLLVETDMSITQISLLTGFREHARLTAFFRQYTGLSPSAFRRREQR